MRRHQRPYEQYTLTGLPWLESIPVHWSTQRIKFSTYVKARIGWQGLTVSERIDEGPYLVTGTDFQNGVVDWSTCEHVTEERYEQDRYIQLQEGDLLITKDGTIGKVAIVKNLSAKATLNSGVFVTRPLKSIYSTDFMYWIISSDVFKGYFDYAKTGSTIFHLYQKTFNEFTFPVPSHPEQRAIADFLDRETAVIDALIAKKYELIKRLQEKRAALINHAVTKGLDLNVPMKESGIEWLGRIPATWEVVPLTKYMESIADYRGRTPEKVDSGLFLITAKNIKNGIVDYAVSQEYVDKKDAEKLLNRGKPKIGDVLFTTEAPLGEVANVDREDIGLAQRIIKFRGKRDVVNNYYLKYWMMSSSFNNNLLSYATGSTAVGIKASKLVHLKLMLPPFSEQVAIANYLECEAANLDDLTAKIEQAIEHLQEYRSALISAAVTGKIDVRAYVQ